MPSSIRDETFVHDGHNGTEAGQEQRLLSSSSFSSPPPRLPSPRSRSKFVGASAMEQPTVPHLRLATPASSAVVATYVTAEPRTNSSCFGGLLAGIATASSVSRSSSLPQVLVLQHTGVEVRKTKKRTISESSRRSTGKFHGKNETPRTPPPQRS